VTDRNTDRNTNRSTDRSTDRSTNRSVTVEPTSDEVRWERACDASGQPVTPFHTFRFLTVVAPMLTNRFRGFVVRAGGADVGVVPWLTLRRGPVTVVNRMPFPYVGPLVPDELLVPTLAALRSPARRSRAVVEEHQFAPGTTMSAETAARCGFELTLDRTFVLDTARSAEDLFAGLTSRTRSLVRKAERNGIAVGVADNGHATLARIEEQIYDRKGLASPYGPPFPPTAAQLVGDRLEAHWSLATSGEQQLATLLTLRRGATSGIWVGGVFPEHRASAANVALVWDAISWAHDHGVSVFDFVGLPDPGIEKFKKQFGGQLQTYPVLRRFAPGWRRVQSLADRVAARRAGRGAEVAPA